MNALPLLWLSISFILGLVTASLFYFPSLLVTILIILGLALTLLELLLGRYATWVAQRKRIIPLPPGILLVMFTLGCLRFITAQPFITTNDLAWYNDIDKVTVIGKVITPPVEGDHFTQVRLKAEELISYKNQLISVDNNAISGNVLLWVQNKNNIEYGDRLQVDGKLVTPMEDATFSYKDYLAHQGINSLMMYPTVIVTAKNTGNSLIAALFDFRERAYRTTNQLFPMPEASLLSGILLGIQKDIPDYLYKAYQATSTAHILVISGFNISIIAAVISRFFRRVLPYGWDMLASLVGIILYTIMVGAQAPVIRAAIMGCLAMPAYLLGRRLIGIHTLSLTAVIMLLFNPLLIGDVSFQMTFLATLGILCFTEPMQEAVFNYAQRHFNNETIQRWYPLVSDVLLVTLAAQFAILPITIYRFGYLSVVSLLANLLILPLQPILEILGGIAILAGMVIHPIGQIFAYLAWFPAAYTDRVAIFLGGFPNILITTSRAWLGISVFLVIVALVLAIRYQFSPKRIQGREL